MDNERVHDETLEIGDAFGEVLLACQRGGASPGVDFELIERSDGHLGVTDAARYFSPSQPPAGLGRGRILDIGAGAGRVSLPLQDAGSDVVALDISAGAIGVCRDRGVRRSFTGTVFDLAATRPAAFDTFLMLGNNLGLLGGREQAPLVLGALAGMAAPGARIIGETLDPYRTRDPEHLAYHEANRRLGRMAGQLRLRIRHLRVATPWFDYLFCTPEELESVIAPTAWELSDAPARPASEVGQWTATLSLRGRK
ncbi:MAG: class I SAM-dependent methyltransferase [Acidimicrobiales bacterium]